jgi:hypothetical protein
MVTGDGSLERSGQLARILRDLHDAPTKVHHCRINQEPSTTAVDEIVTLQIIFDRC